MILFPAALTNTKAAAIRNSTSSSYNLLRNIVKYATLFPKASRKEKCPPRCYPRYFSQEQIPARERQMSPGLLTREPRVRNLRKRSRRVLRNSQTTL